MEPSAIERIGLALRRDPPPENGDVYVPLADGSFTLEASAGDYRVNVSYLPRGAYVKSIRIGNEDILNAGLRVKGTPSALMEVVIARNPGALEGQVVSNGRGLAADAAVVLIPDNRRRIDLYLTTTTDSAGRFHFDAVPPGNYKVFSWEEVEDGTWFEAEFMKSIEGRGLAVRIGESAMEPVRIEVIRN